MDRGDVPRQIHEYYPRGSFEREVEEGGVGDLACESATAIARVGPDVLDAVLDRIDGPEIDAIVQAGTNLPAVAVAFEGTTVR